MKNFFTILILTLCSSLFAQPGSNDPTFNTYDDGSLGDGSGFNSQVSVTAIQPDGKIIVGGMFTSYNGFIRSRIARLNADGSLDTNFDPGMGFNDEVSSIAIQPDGKILLGGEFTTFNDAASNSIARLNVDGSYDTTFDIGTGFNDEVKTIAVQADGKILVGGIFSDYNGVNANYFVRLNVDGSFDSTFSNGSVFDNYVTAIDIQADGKILVAGNFTAHNGEFGKNLIRLNVDGSRDFTFNASITFSAIDETIAIQNDGKIILGGYFSLLGSQQFFNVVRFNIDGTLDNIIQIGFSIYVVKSISIQDDGKIIVATGVSPYIFRSNADGTVDPTFNIGTGFSQPVESLSIQADGKIVVGGSFSSYNTNSAFNVARLNADGNFDNSLNPQAGFNFSVEGMAIQSNGKIIVGGYFTSFNENQINRIVRLNPDGLIDNSFNPGEGFNAYVKSIAIQPDGKIIVGGDFTSFNGTLINRIVRLNADGSLDATFNPGLGFNDYIQTIAIQEDGKIIVGGNFTSFNGSSINRITRLHADGSLDANFNPGIAFNQVITSMCIQIDGKIIVGGGFTSFDGTPITRIARLNSDGSLDATFDPGTGFNSTVRSTVVQSDGKIIVGGQFGFFNGVSASRIARLNVDGSLDSSFDPGTGFNNLVLSTAIQSDGKIIAGGSFTSFNGATANRITRLNTDGTLDNTFIPGTGFNYNVNSIVIQMDGNIVVGGIFSQLNGVSRKLIARLINCLPTTGTDVITACDNYTWIDGITYTESNNTVTYNIIGGAANSCDSLVTLNLTIAGVTDDCGVCISGGDTNPNWNQSCVDCNGVLNGTAFLDDCNVCVGGNTGLEACVADCNGEFGGTAFTDGCGDCVGGNTGELPCEADPISCTDGIDNDGNGLIDCDDPACQLILSNLGCGTCFNDGLSFADVVLEYQNNCVNNVSTDPEQALGIPNYSGAPQTHVTLGRGFIKLGFTNNTLINSGSADPDLFVFEVGPLVESSSIELRPANSETETILIQIGITDVDDDGYYEFGSIGGAIASVDIDAFLQGLSANSVQFDAIKIVDAPGSCATSTPGADIDAVCALSSLDCSVGQPCDDGNENTENDLYNVNCECIGTPIFDCEELEANNGDACTLGESVGMVIDCECLLADCNGDFGGTAFFDNCDVCVGGNTGLEPCIDPCEGLIGDNAANPIIITGFPYSDIQNTAACFTNQYAPVFGSPDVFYQLTTGPNTTGLIIDLCNPGTDFNTFVYLVDASGTITWANNDDSEEGETCSFLEEIVSANTTYYVVVEGFGASDVGFFELTVDEVLITQDCNGDFGGTAFLDDCEICVGGNTGLVACIADCNGDFGGSAFLDDCDVCVGGNTGLVACISDCNGDFGGTAYLDDCDVCVGGNTGLEPCVNEIPLTQLQFQFCNGSYQFSNAVSCDNVLGAQDYRWQLTPLGGSPLPEYTRSYANRNLRLSWISGIQLGTTYEVRVKAKVNGEWGIYGDMCTINTVLDVPFTQLSATYSPLNPTTGLPYVLCNNILADYVYGAESFEWELTGPNTLLAESPSYFIKLGSIPGIQMNTVYQVRVRVRVDGQWGSFNVQLPIQIGNPANTQLIAVNCGSTRQLNQAVAAINVCGAQSYTFRFQHPSEPERILVRTPYTCPLWQMQPPLTPGETYSVSVKVAQGGVDGDYSTACDVTIAGPQAAGLADDLLVSKLITESALGIYPNPNSGSEVRIELNGIEDGAHEVAINIYDIYGKLITRDSFGHQGVQLSHIVHYEQKLAVGMYLIHVSIDGEIFESGKIVVQ